MGGVRANDSRLWARVTDTIRLFLRAQWRLGALYGRTEEQAFFITCNETVMSQDDILNGRLICEIGIAPVVLPSSSCSKSSRTLPKHSVKGATHGTQRPTSKVSLPPGDRQHHAGGLQRGRDRRDDD